MVSLFDARDIYTTSGSNILYNCWTPNVTKFDSSSFYNFEQDNEPLYDLEERTYLNWEKHGFPGSSIAGLALVVSADYPLFDVGGDANDDSSCNSNIYASVSAAINSLPNVINFPVLIEVANFGDLGEAKINNFKFGPRGSIEIINRNYSDCPGFTRTGVLLNSLDIDDTAGNLDDWELASGVSGYAISVYNFSPRGIFQESSALSISSLVFSSTTDSRLVGNLNGGVGFNQNFAENRTTYIISPNNDRSPYAAGAADKIQFKAYEYNPEACDGILTKDTSAYNEITGYAGGKFTFTHATAGEAAVDEANYIAAGMLYGNKFSHVEIKNCDGPIYFRHFFIDGSGVAANVEYGLQIDNSSDVFIENCMAVRCKKAGIKIQNSKVNVLRGISAYRNYSSINQRTSRYCPNTN